MGSETIIIVDDREDVREIIEIMLRKAGYRVYSFASANDAMAISKNIRVDLFLIDVVMPHVNGIELLKSLNVKENSYEVIMITGSSDYETTARAMGLGAFGFLRKPFLYAELIRMVNSAIKNSGKKKRLRDDVLEKPEMVRDGAMRN